MDLQSFTVSIGALTDANNNGKNYVSDEAIYVKTIGGTFAPIFRDLAGTSEIAQDGLANKTNEKGQFKFFVEAGDYILEYQKQSTPVTIVGADYFNNRVEETVIQIIEETQKSRGFRVVGKFADGFTYENYNQVGIDADGNSWIYVGAGAPNKVVAAGTVPSAPDYEQVTFNALQQLTGLNLPSDLDFVHRLTFGGVQDMQDNTNLFIRSAGQKVSTGLTTWLINDKGVGIAITGTSLHAKPLNGVFIDDCGAVADALYYVSSAWYSDPLGTQQATDNTTAFLKAMEATGGTDSKGTINFGFGGYLIDPSSIGVDGIDIRRKTLRGLGPENTTVIQAGLNTYQTFFRNNPRNLSEAGTWGSGGTFNIFDMYIRGNWDGASGQQYVPPESGKGNGITGILKAEYDFDVQGGVLQLISSTRAFINNVWVSHGYGHNIKYYRSGYGELMSGRSFATRGSGAYILCPQASDAFTSTPIYNMRFETCRGQYGGIYATHIWGSSINNCLFEGQPYGIYLEEGGDVDTSGNYLEGHYFNDDFYIDGKCWGITDFANYAFNQTDPRSKPYKGLMHYRRDSGLHIDTDNSTYGTRPASINGNYFQNGAIGIGVQPLATGNNRIVHHVRRQIAAGGAAGSLGGYTAIRHDHRDTDNAGAAEIRFKRNLSNDSRSGLGFATTENGTDLIERWGIDSNGDLVPSAENSVNIGSASKRVVQIFAILPTHADEAAAVTAGLATGQMYKTTTGELRIKL